MAKIGNWVLESSDTIGAGTIKLTGSVEGLARFRDAMPTGLVWYSVEEGSSREAGVGTFNGINTITRVTVHATLIKGVYNDVNPTAIFLNGSALVSCTFNSAAYRELLSHLSMTDNPHDVEAGQVAYDPVADPVSSSTNVQNALIDHGLSILQYADHTALNNRDADNQHPVSAVTGLQAALDSKDDITSVDAKLALKDDITSVDAKLALKDDITSVDAKLALKDDITSVDAKLALKANKNNAVLTGVPTAPTASLGDVSTQIATTEFVRDNSLSESMPIGFLLHFGGVAAPPGYLSCDGSTHLKTAYPELYVAIGDLWATTGGASAPAGDSFRVPPQEVGGLGLYLRGDGDTTVVGEYQADVFKEHTHVVPGTLVSAAGGGGRTLSPLNTNSIPTLSTGDSTETRPRSITALLCIKASHV